jgi:DNA repair exonuclease SbcCD ATPase subunit
MIVNPGAWDYICKAFNARPMGMFVPPNWIGLGSFAILGLLNPGFWVIGLGVELAYLWILGTNKRFQRLVDASQKMETRQQWQTRIDALVHQLGNEDQQRYRALEVRCWTLMEQRHSIQTPSSGLQAQGEGLSRLLWVYLRLLATRQAINRILRSQAGAPSESTGLEERISNLQSRLKEEISEELRKSLSGQIEILQQRLDKRREAKEKLVFLDAELTRIQEQVELVREQSVVSADPETLSKRIDEVTATLGGTAQWISDQQKLYGAVEDLMSEPPPLQIKNSE